MSGMPNQPSLADLHILNQNLLSNTQHTLPKPTFTFQLMGVQARALSRLLPPSHKLVFSRNIRTKRINKRKLLKCQPNGEENEESFQSVDGRPQAEPEEEEESDVRSEEVEKKCRKILSLLRKHKSSWPFRAPVNPVAMGIPHYTSVIPHPMDLETIEKRLVTHKYQSLPKFYGDIRLIISNSLTFNAGNT
jgi:hypothetical protein